MKPRTVKLLIAIVLGAAAVIALPFSLRTINELRRFLAEWIARMNPIYLAISLPPAFQYPGEAPNSALAYFDGYRTVNLPANLLQAQRDYFGAHTYERVDRPRGEFFHTNWTGRGGTTSSSSYVV